jgi:hypothetical protein
VSETTARWLGFARLALAVALLVALFWYIGLGELVDTLASARLGYVVLALALSLLNVALASWRWLMLLRDRHCHVPFARLVRIYFVSGFLANFLPSSMATDGLRVFYAAGYTRDVNTLVSSMVLDRIIGFFAMAVIALLSFAALPLLGALQLGRAVSLSLVGFSIVALALPFVVFHPAVARLVHGILDRWRRFRIVARLAALYDSLLSYRESPRTMAKVTALAIVTTLRGVLLFFVVAKAFSSDVSILYFLLLVPLMSVVESLPLSLAGLGVNEGAIVLYFSQVGMPTEVSASIALIVRAVSIAGTLPGGVLYLFDRTALRQALARGDS